MSVYLHLFRYLFNRLQLFARLEAHGFARRNGNFRAGARVAADAGFARLYVEDAESAQLDAVAFGERTLHALEDGFDGNFGLGFGDARLGNHFVDDVQLDQGLAPAAQFRIVYQVLDAKEDKRDCQRHGLSRKMHCHLKFGNRVISQ